jgi:hypothetical protein
MGRRGKSILCPIIRDMAAAAAAAASVSLLFKWEQWISRQLDK